MRWIAGLPAEDVRGRVRISAVILLQPILGRGSAPLRERCVRGLPVH